MDDFDQVFLGCHYRVDGLVSGRCFVDNVSILTTFDTFGHTRMVLNTEAALGFASRHRATRAVAAAFEALRVAETPDDIRPCPHAAGNDSEFAPSGADGAFPCD